MPSHAWVHSYTQEPGETIHLIISTTKAGIRSVKATPQHIHVLWTSPLSPSKESELNDVVAPLTLTSEWNMRSEERRRTHLIPQSRVYRMRCDYQFETGVRTHKHTFNVLSLAKTLLLIGNQQKTGTQIQAVCHQTCYFLSTNRIPFREGGHAHVCLIVSVTILIIC